MDKVAVYIKQFDYYKLLAERAIDQLEDDLLFTPIAEETNSIAVIMKHIAGNQLSRWTNFFEEDGEKEWRMRDREFIDDFSSKDELLRYWEKGWKTLFDVLATIDDSDLSKIIYIRNMGCTVHDAIIRQICHYPYHVGQIVFLARYFKKESFKSLSIPKGQSDVYNEKRFNGDKTIKHFTDDV